MHEAICCICREKISVSQGNTSNLESHLRVNHPVEFGRLGCSSSTPASDVEQPHASNDSWISPRYLQEELSSNVTGISGEHLKSSLIINLLRMKHMEKTETDTGNR